MSWSEIAKTSAVAASAGTTITTAAINTVGADLIIIQANSYAKQVAPSDNMSNVWTPIGSYFGTSYYGELYYCYNPTTSSAHTFTVTDGTTTYPGVAVLAVSGSAASPLDQHNGNILGTSASTIQPGSITPTADGELIVSGLLDDADGSNTVSSTVNIDFYSFNSSTTWGIGTAIGYYVQATAGAINPTWNVSAAKPLGATVASFKVASSNITGTVAVTLSDVTSTVSGGLENIGTVASTLADTVSTVSATVENLGSASSTLDNIAVTASGLLENIGTVSSTLDAIVSTVSASLDVIGTASDTLEAVTSAVNAALTNIGTVNVTLADITSSASGIVLGAITGTANITLSDITNLAGGLVGGYEPGIHMDALTGGPLVSRLETALPIELSVSNNGGVSGLTVKARIRDGGDVTSYLDFNDMTFKTTGWTIKETTLSDLTGGFYHTSLNLTLITNLPVSNNLIIEYTVTGTINGVALAIVTFDQTWENVKALTVGKFIALKDA